MLSADTESGLNKCYPSQIIITIVSALEVGSLTPYTELGELFLHGLINYCLPRQVHPVLSFIHPEYAPVKALPFISFIAASTKRPLIISSPPVLWAPLVTTQSQSDS